MAIVTDAKGNILLEFKKVQEEELDRIQLAHH
ncbi:hypothetical protein QFZ77_003066 [Paenibacillus sp. V4I3]|nr:hypothetical protein [Paenibacillus sp. V4I3]MDQ0889876.1 hypothetical protein [Paenibacillus sp. V4I9]